MTVTEGGVTTTSTYTYDGLTLLSVATAASDGTTSSVTYLADGSGRPYGGVFASSESTAVAFGIVTTDRGDVRALTDELGVAFAFYSYDAYGNPRDAQTRATSLDATTSAEVAGANVLRYAGYAYDPHSGLYYCSARHYDPATASFITKDPAKADGEESAYQYCGGDPVGKVDPSGLRMMRPEEEGRRWYSWRWASGRRLYGAPGGWYPYLGSVNTLVHCLPWIAATDLIAGFLSPAGTEYSGLKFEICWRPVFRERVLQRKQRVFHYTIGVPVDMSPKWEFVRSAWILEKVQFQVSLVVSQSESYGVVQAHRVIVPRPGARHGWVDYNSLTRAQKSLIKYPSARALGR